MAKINQQQLRIIGGRWRSRRLRFPVVDGCRPTLDRVRETLFNWLQYDIDGAQVLDAFAGSGALGLEALSRGAKSVIFIEKHPKVALQLKNNLEILETKDAQVWAADSIQWLTENSRLFDVVFLDPPFNKNLLQPAIDALNLVAGAKVYLEFESNIKPQIPDHWLPCRSKATKEFTFALYEVGESGNSND